MKTKLIQSVQILDKEISYKEILKEVNDLKTQIQNQLKEEGLENEFEVIVDVNNERSSISLRQEHSDYVDIELPPFESIDESGNYVGGNPNFL